MARGHSVMDSWSVIVSRSVTEKVGQRWQVSQWPSSVDQLWSVMIDQLSTVIGQWRSSVSDGQTVNDGHQSVMVNEGHWSMTVISQWWSNGQWRSLVNDGHQPVAVRWSMKVISQRRSSVNDGLMVNEGHQSMTVISQWWSLKVTGQWWSSVSGGQMVNEGHWSMTDNDGHQWVMVKWSMKVISQWRS